MSRNPVNVFPLIQKIAEASLKNQVVNDGDRYDAEGFLICGECGERKQIMKEIADPLPDDVKHTSWIKVPKECKCVRDKRESEERDKNYQRLWSLSFMEEKYRDATFESFEINEFNKDNYSRCKKYADGFDEMYADSQGLLMYGDVGTGKSWSAACICNYLMRRGVSCIMISPIQILRLIENEPQKAKDVQERIKTYRLAVIDELGGERNTGYSSEKVYGIINERLLSKKPMIITTNNKLSDMMEEEDIRFSRIYDRIFETCYPMKFVGDSWRKIEANKRYEKMEAFFSEN